MSRRLTDAAIEAMFTYHAPTSEQRIAYDRINTVAMQLARVINDACPDCPDKSAAIRLVREARMTANAAIACEPDDSTVDGQELSRQLGYSR